MKAAFIAALTALALAVASSPSMAQTGPSSTGVGADKGAGSGKASPATGQASRAQTPGEQSAKAVQQTKKRNENSTDESSFWREAGA
jgi:hypothetical protein